MSSPMCDRSKSPAAFLTALCSAVSLPYRSGISHSANSVMVAPSPACTAASGVRRSAGDCGSGICGSEDGWTIGGLAYRCAGPRDSPASLGSAGVGCEDRSMTLLTEDEITASLGRAAGWERAGNAITRTVKLGDFRDAMLYVGAVAHLAQAANHHPDIAIAWNKVTLTLSTHSAGGLTQADFALAQQISALP